MTPHRKTPKIQTGTETKASGWCMTVQGGAGRYLTSSRSPEGDGIPPLARWVSCFVEVCLPWFHSGLVLRPLHRRCLPAGPAVGSGVLERLETWLSFQSAEERVSYSGQHVSAFTRGNDLPRNPQTLFSCQCTEYLFFPSRTKTETEGRFPPHPLMKFYKIVRPPCQAPGNFNRGFGPAARNLPGNVWRKSGLTKK